MKISKITVGFVIQTFDTDKGQFVSQDFIAGDEVTYEDLDGNVLDAAAVMPTPEPYLPFDMVQPNEDFL